MRLKSRGSIVAAATAGLLAAELVGAPDALAAQSVPGANGSCSSGDFCAWRHDDRGGGIMDTPNAIPSYPAGLYGGYGYWGSSIYINDNHSSVQNRFNIYCVIMYEHSGYSGTSEVYLRQMTGYKNVEAALEDEASSHKGVSC